jgi:pilus assembly protein Flp/PilA
MNALVKFLKDEDGVVAIEYVVIAAALVAGLTLVFTGVGDTLTAKLNEIVNGI